MLIRKAVYHCKDGLHVLILQGPHEVGNFWQEACLLEETRLLFLPPTNDDDASQANGVVENSALLAIFDSCFHGK
jgi:hypothetical protein